MGRQQQLHDPEPDSVPMAASMTAYFDLLGLLFLFMGAESGGLIADLHDLKNHRVDGMQQ